MLHVDVERWRQTADDLRQLARDSAHRRTRERFLALYEVAKGWSATAWADETERRHETVRRWVCSYNEGGPAAMVYRRTGGWSFFLKVSVSSSAI